MEYDINYTDEELQAEQSLLGDILIDGRCISRTTGIEPKDFICPHHFDIYEALLAVSKESSESTDPVAILSYLSQNGKIWDGARKYIVDLMYITPTAANVDIHASAVLRLSACRIVSNIYSLDIDAANCAIMEAQKKLRMSESRTKPELPIKMGNDVEDDEPEFLFFPYIRTGKLNMIAADPDRGKTSLFCYMVAMVTTGRDLEGNKIRDPQNVLILSVEDDLSDLRNRIANSGGDVSKVAFFDQSKFYEDHHNNGDAITFNDPMIETTVRNLNAKLVVFDPMQNFLGTKVDMNQANKTRPVLAKLQNMAETTNCAVVLLAHNGKSQQRSAMMRSLGSVDIVGAMRSVLTVGYNPDSDDESERICVHIKSNNAKKGKSFAYRLDRVSDTQMKVTWIGYTDHKEEDLDRSNTIANRKKTGTCYDDEPIVAVVRKFITDNPNGGFICWDDFLTIAETVLGFVPMEARTLGHSIKALIPEMAKNDRIKLELGTIRPKQYRLDGSIVTPAARYAKPGVQITRIVIPKEFQTTIDDSI